ncbi:sigma-70 family RNA polymerase sigma factor [Pseudoclavibacter helvolus]|uniref:sigma-70 family RNA polymerase sigma factor n=1 Tax=Pseudoclavibacter helvolus TaxID=255205 RepID=UPI003C779A94
MDDTDTRVHELDAERSRLEAMAFRMLGTRAEAEDAVQEGFARFLSMSAHQQAEVRVPAAWLTRVVSRICLDVLGSARRTREHYVGEWLPEPLPASALPQAPEAVDPERAAVLAESVSTALLVVLESLTPAERVVFVLREVFAVPFAEVAEALDRSVDACRQLAVSARRRLAHRGAWHPGDGVATSSGASAATSRAARLHEHDQLVEAFALATQSGDLDALTRILVAGAKLRSDGNGMRGIARRPVVGADNVARFLLGIAARRHDIIFERSSSADGACLVVRNRSGLEAVLNVGTARGKITDVWIVLVPEKLTMW